MPKDDKILDRRETIKLMDTVFNTNPLQSVDLLKTLKAQQSYTVIFNSTGTASNFYSHMPVAKLHSDDAMPIAGRNNSTAFNMPVKKIKLMKPDTALRVIGNNIIAPTLNSRE